MNENGMTPLKITDLVLRDGHQSLLATRWRTEDMLPIAAQLDDVGFWSLEVWGGATFDTCMRFLNEDPWERLRQLKARIKKTPLQMLLRGQNVVGYRNYADDVLERFIVKAHENGIDVFRIFDALNDTRNMAMAMRIANARGCPCSGRRLLHDQSRPHCRHVCRPGQAPGRHGRRFDLHQGYGRPDLALRCLRACF